MSVINFSVVRLGVSLKNDKFLKKTTEQLAGFTCNCLNGQLTTSNIWLSDWLPDCPTAWLINGVTFIWPLSKLSSWLTNSLAAWLTDGMADCLAGWLTDYLAVGLADRLSHFQAKEMTDMANERYWLLAGWLTVALSGSWPNFQTCLNEISYWNSLHL